MRRDHYAAIERLASDMGITFEQAHEAKLMEANHEGDHLIAGYIVACQKARVSHS